MQILQTLIKRNQFSHLGFVLAIVPLMGAYLSQYGFGLEPCILCLYQRLPYLVIAIVLLALYPLRNRPSLMLRLMIFSFLLFLIDAGIAFYHVGVEQQWWQSATDCGDTQGTPDSLEALKAQLFAAPVVRCDQPAFVFLGLSMAAWNALYALLAALVMAVCVKIHLVLRYGTR